MNRLTTLGILVGLALTLMLGTGCFKLLKLFSVDAGTISAVNGNPSGGKYIVLADESSDYADNQDKIKDIEEYTLLGHIKNNLASPVTAEVWIVESPSGSTLLGDKASVMLAGGKKLLTVDLAASQEIDLSWGASPGHLFFASLFALTPANDPVVAELKGDGIFAIYVFGSTSTYNVTVTNAQFLVTVYVGP